MRDLLTQVTRSVLHGAAVLGGAGQSLRRRERLPV
jgi:hypothetical protein